MAIGVFDSGVGGLTVHRVLVDRLATADFVFLADQANMPYGVRNGEDIVTLTRLGCERLFAEGCDLVILACNTAAAIALRRLQQSWLPGFRQRLGRPVNILGLIVPTIEQATGLPWTHTEPTRRNAARPDRLDSLGIFSTPATSGSRVYEIEIDKRRPDIAVYSEPCPELARLIEAGASVTELTRVIQGHAAALTARIGEPPRRAVLGCTHYEIVAPIFTAVLPPGTPVIHQPEATADAVEQYLLRHPEYDAGHTSRRRFITTGRPGQQNGLVEQFWGGPLHFEAA